MRATGLVLLLLSCEFADPEPAPKSVVDGKTCTADDHCKSGKCSGGFCAASGCGCGTLMACGTAPKRSDDCQRGWSCLGTPITAFVTGVCKLPCTAGCPSTWSCKDTYCVFLPPDPIPPKVTIEAAPEELVQGTAGTFRASATAGSGTLAALWWDFGSGVIVDGGNATHTFTEIGIRSVRAVASDEDRIEGSASHSVRVCLPVGAECYPFTQQGNCCTGDRCVAADGGARCVR